jgi:hypothetical protein
LHVPVLGGIGGEQVIIMVPEDKVEILSTVFCVGVGTVLVLIINASPIARAFDRVFN